jgi:3',5'-cyclic AMP phosphodiesterase CpdA
LGELYLNFCFYESTQNMPTRIAHFSDLHLTALPLKLNLLDWFGKRTVGWLNSRIGRGHTFRDANEISRRLLAELPERSIDHILFTGDATQLGLPTEFDVVRDLFRDTFQRFPGTAMPGNHDHYTRRSVWGNLFEDTFADWQAGERVSIDTYPYARRVGPLWLIAINSSRPNASPWDSRGEVGRPQRKRLVALLEQLSPGPRILVTHYPVCLADGHSEKRWRKLRDAHQVAEIARTGNIKLWCHGHRHVSYIRPADERFPFAISCAGSATQFQRWSYCEYSFEDTKVDIQRRTWSPERKQFEDAERVHLLL